MGGACLHDVEQKVHDGYDFRSLRLAVLLAADSLSIIARPFIIFADMNRCDLEYQDSRGTLGCVSRTGGACLHDVEQKVHNGYHFRRLRLAVLLQADR